MEKILIKIGAGLVVVLVLLYSSAFIVMQTQQALVLQFGEIVREVKEPGLRFKVPFIQDVIFFEKRLLDFRAQPAEFITKDRNSDVEERVVIDAFVRYRITDPLQFKQAVADERTMKSRLNSILESSLRQVLGSVPLSAVISEKRPEIMQSIRTLVNQQAMGAAAGDKENVRGFGIEVVDVRIKRADLPPANSEGIYKRMQTERERQAKEFRARGAEDAQKIRSQADKERTILLADAKKTAETTRGEGDGLAGKIFADAFGQDQDFYQFYRTMQAYKKTLMGKDTTMILSPDSEFFKLLDKGGER